MSPFHRLLQVGAAWALCLCGAVAPALAGNVVLAPNDAPLPPQGSPVADAQASHIQTKRLDIGRIGPVQPKNDRNYLSYDGGKFDPRAPLTSATRDASARAANRAAAPATTCPDYTATGSTLVANVLGSDLSGCLYPLFNLTGSVAQQTFNEAQMITIANAIQANAPGYPGDNSTNMLQLIMFLRAGYYVQWYHASDVGAYTANLTNAIRPALDAFVAEPHFGDVNDNHGAVLREFVTLIDSAAENAHQLQPGGAVPRILANYNGPVMDSMPNMLASTFNVFNVLFRGHQKPDFQAYVQTQAGSAITGQLHDFINNNKASDVGSDREYLLADAGMELARFLQYPDAGSGSFLFHTSLHPLVLDVLNWFPLTSSTSPGMDIYVNAASVADYWDDVHCSYFGICNLGAKIEPIILPDANAKTCSPTLKVRSQALTADQLTWVCDTVTSEEYFFHHTMPGQTDTPVPDDNNTQLEMVVFNSSSDYTTYSGLIFGNDTNNGGIYLEGDPSQVGNQPRFLCYRAEWESTFDIWNLTHEYTHYLDGRFNWWGSFSDYPLTAPASAVWYIEGFAEYESYTFRNLVDANAVGDAQQTPAKWLLSQVFDTEYSTDYDRTYQWGYMSVRFMFERHLSDITTLYTTVSRLQNAYTPGYQNWLDAIRTKYNADFQSWIACYAANNGSTATCGGPQPDKIFANGFDGAPPPSECPIVGGSDQTIGNGCVRSGIAQPTQGWYKYYSLNVPAGATNLVITTSGGTGNADLYVKAGSWPQSNDFDVSSTHADNNESVTVATPQSGYYYIALLATLPFSDVVLEATYTP